MEKRTHQNVTSVAFFYAYEGLKDGDCEFHENGIFAIVTVDHGYIDEQIYVEEIINKRKDTKVRMFIQSSLSNPIFEIIRSGEEDYPPSFNVSVEENIKGTILTIY